MLHSRYSTVNRCLERLRFTVYKKKRPDCAFKVTAEQQEPAPQPDWTAVLVSQGNEGVFSFSKRTFSMVSASYLLYGTMMSGSSWCRQPHLPHFSRRMISVCHSPSEWRMIRFLLPTTSIGQSQSGQEGLSFLLT